MTEITVAFPLSGEEIKDLARQQFESGLESDCYINSNLAYEACELEVYWKLRLIDNNENPVIEREFKIAGGSPEARERLQEAPFHEARLEIGQQPPNAVRQAAGMPIPTLTENADGKREVKPVKYAKRTEHESEHEKKEHEKEHDPKKPPQPGQPGQPGQTHPGQEQPKR